MSIEMRVGQILRIQKLLNNANVSNFKYFRESAMLAKPLVSGSGLTIAALSSGQPIWAKFTMAGYPASSTLKLSAEEIRDVCRLQGLPTLAPVTGIRKYLAELELTARQNAITKQELDEFLAYWADNELAFAKKIMDFSDTPDDAKTLLRNFKFMRQLGISAQQMSKVFVLAASLNSKVARDVFYHIATKGPGLIAKLQPLGAAAAKVGFLISVLEIYNLIVKREWGQVAATVYKSMMGLAVPWAAAIDALQSLLPDPSPQSIWVFKLIRACDPIGLGAVAVDSFVFMVQALINGMRGRDFDEKRLADLVERMKKGPTSWFAELGDRSGDALYDIMQMDARDWQLVWLYTKDEFGAWIRGVRQ